MKDYSNYNINEIIHDDPFWLVFPGEIANHMVSCCYRYSQNNKTSAFLEEYKSALAQWKADCEDLRKSLVGKPSLFYNDGGQFLVIHDLRSECKKKYILDETERDIYLFCDAIRTFQEIASTFSAIKLPYIQYALNTFMQHRLMFSENDEYLSLAVKFRCQLPVHE